MNKVYLITGCNGNIGYFLSKRILENGHCVVGIDNMNSYYDVSLKEDRYNFLKKYSNFKFVKGDISNKEFVLNIFKEERPNIVVNLAAQAGVRYSLENPDAYISSNIIGFYNILEACKEYSVDHLLYASSSSVYGANKKVPFSEKDFVDHPVSLYAATKKSNELIAYTYNHLYKIPMTGMRFFTVYGPMGRPDMAYFSFVDKFFNGEEICIFNNGDFVNDLYRDFTYIDDIIDAILGLISLREERGEEQDYQVYNIGNNSPVKLMEFIRTLEKCLSKSLGKTIEFKKKFEPMKPGDVYATYADTSKLYEKIHFQPNTSLEKGLQNFTDWYVEYYKKNI